MRFTRRGREELGLLKLWLHEAVPEWSTAARDYGEDGAFMVDMGGTSDATVIRRWALPRNTAGTRRERASECGGP